MTHLGKEITTERKMNKISDLSMMIRKKQHNLNECRIKMHENLEKKQNTKLRLQEI